MGDAVTVTDEDVLAVEGIGGAVAGSLKGFLVALKEDHATTVAHVDAIRIEIRSLDTAATAYGHTVVALRALTAVVPGDEEVVPAVVLEDERRLDGVGTSEVGRGVLRGIGINGEGLLAIGGGEVEATGDGTRLY